MNESHIAKVAYELGLGVRQVRAASELLDQGSTVPFIARYRKEATGRLDEVAIVAIRDRIDQLRELDKRRESILDSLAKRGLLTDELKANILSAEAMAMLEDFYLPYRPKHRTRAVIARERGLEPLAKMILAQDGSDPVAEAARFVNRDKGVNLTEEALAGARDIIAEWINEDAATRSQIRSIFQAQGILRSKAAKDLGPEGMKYEDYVDWSEPICKVPSHRLMAMIRAQKEGFLSIHIEPPKESIKAILESNFVRSAGISSQQVRMAANDGYKRLLAPSMETEILSKALGDAEEMAVKVFAENLRQLLLEAPLGQKKILAIDPGFRTGCKVVVLDGQGQLVQNDTIYPHEPQRQEFQAAKKIIELCERFKVEVIAIGNGTAGRETESFARKLKLPEKLHIIMVNESGASVYSASEAAREEFPKHDITVRGAVSIGRRLMDPLAELVKIDPRSIGVGQYQHDVDQSALKKKLDEVVESCVNLVGVDVNTASKALLSYVSGLGEKLAEAIVKYRNEHGPFRSRQDLMNVPRLGPKAFEQAAGFLRIRGENPLDASAVHPESYPIVEAMAKDQGVTIQELMKDQSLQRKIDLKRYVTDKIGMPTLNDILSEFSKPSRDPRKEFEAFSFAKGVEKIEDLKPGMKLSGIVTNITAFGAFVDVGVHQDGLVHISQLSDKFVHSPADVVKVHQKVMVTVMDMDLGRKRISLSMREMQNDS
jgi:protein Tex